jgi:bacterioferritin
VAKKTKSKSKSKVSVEKKIVDELIVAYWAELETVQNYLANSNNLDGVRAEEIKKALAADVTEEIGHAQQIAGRIRVLGGTVPGSAQFKAQQKTLQPPKDSTDVVSVIQGVIDAEQSAIEQYQKIIELCDGVDYPTQDLCITLMADEQNHLREFRGFLKEYK